MLPHLRHRSSTRPVAVAVLTASLATTVACTPLSDGDDAATSCESTVGAAAAAVEVADQVRFLDQALLQCRSVASLTAELERHPGLIGYSPQAFIEIRCSRIDDPDTLAAPTCRSVTAPSTTAPPTTVVELLYVGETVDGRRVEIRPSASTSFEGDVPAVVQQTVDIALESGCDGLLEQRDLWFSRIADTPAGDEASVYARHAQNVADYIGCELPPFPA